MREPRPRQRLPEGGLEIYEQRKAGTWDHPALLFAQPPDWRSPRATPRAKEWYLKTGYVLIYQPHFDPLLYFWPVDGCHLIVRTDNLDADHTKLLVRAALRDGAELVVTHLPTALTSCSRFFDQASGWKKPTHEIDYDVPPPTKKSRYDKALAAIRDEERG